MKLTLTDDGTKYRLETDSEQTITLTVRETLALCQLAESIRGQSQPEQPRGAIATIRIRDAPLTLDAHHTDVILCLEGRAYAMSPDVAQKVCDGLALKLDEIHAAASLRSKAN